MLYYFQRKKLCRHLLVGGALFAAGFGMFSCSDTYDLDSKQPTDVNGKGLQSIYGYMESQGNYSTFMQLIKDLGQDEILSKTGSKTLFVADDNAFAEFFKSNKWGVSSYGQLTMAQKKLLLYSAMIDNPYTTSMLSNAAGLDAGSPTRGEVCRRNSSLAIYDSVLVVNTNSDILPQNPRFDELRASHPNEDVVIFTDNSAASPMVHFTAKYIAANKIDYSDIDFIFNDKNATLASNPGEFLCVNNARVKNISDDANIYCKNGFVHKVDRVIMPLDNMAEIIRTNPDTKIYSSILERYAALDYSRELTDAYNNNKGTDYDSVFIKRYYSDRTYGSTVSTPKAFEEDKNGIKIEGKLKFDPGWNTFTPSLFNARDAMMEDMAVMLVPTDIAMTTWWEEGGGSVVKDYYGSLDATPLTTLQDLVNVNMIESFNSAVPSRFKSVLNDANERLGITEDDVDHVEIGCNGLVYYTKKVFAPTSYSSVLFPAVVDTTQFKVVKKAIDQLDYKAYLNSMVSTYSFFLPTNDGLLTYIDPVSYGSLTTNMWQFKYDKASDNIFAEVWACQQDADGKWQPVDDKYVARVGWSGNKAIGCKGQITNTGGDAIMTDRMEDILDNCIVIEPLIPGKKFYKTKGNNFVKIEGVVDDENSMKVYGSGQVETQNPLNVSRIYNMENGKTYIVDGPIMGAQKTVAARLSEYPDFEEFLTVLQYSGAVNKTNKKDNWSAAALEDMYGNLFNYKTYGNVGAEDKPAGTSSSGKAVYLLNNYHYTVYAPTNDGMEKAYAMGLPRPSDIDAIEAEKESAEEFYKAQGLSEQQISAKIDSLDLEIDMKREAMLDFIKYHIQDNSIYMDEGFEGGTYETAKTELIKSSGVAEKVKEEDIEKYNIVSGTKPEMDADGTYTVQYYTGKYTPGRPYKTKVNVSSSSMTVTDNLGETRNVVPALANIQAREYWVKTASISTPYTHQIENSSSIVIQGIDGPLVYDMDQFVYKYKQIDSNANVKPRR